MKSTDQYLIHPGQVIDLHGQKVPLELLFRGMLITGSPGTGKTRCVLLPLLEAILKTTGTNPDKKSTMVISDPKNELGPHLESILSRIGRADDLIAGGSVRINGAIDQLRADHGARASFGLPPNAVLFRHW